MFGWLRSSERSKIRSGERLYKDAVTIIETDRQTCSDKHMQRVAELVSKEFARTRQRLEQRPKDRAVIRYDIQAQHKNARTRRDNAQLTAMTLVLIHMQASSMDHHGKAATGVIQGFLDNPLVHSDSDSDHRSDADTNSDTNDGNKTNRRSRDHLSA